MPDIQIPSLDGAKFNAYAALPKGGNGPGVLVVHEAAGISVPVCILCDKLAGHGYMAVYPDLTWRQASGARMPQDPATFDSDAGLRDLLATLAFMRHMPGCSSKVGVLGYGLGGRLAFLMAARSDIDCAVSYYGLGIEPYLEEMEDITAPFLLHLAERDSTVSKAEQEKIRAAAEHNAKIAVHSYAEAAHAFAIPENPNFNQAAATEAETRTLAFLSKHLSGS